MVDDIELTTGGVIYTGWISISCDRQIDALGSKFTISVTRPNTPSALLAIARYTPCQLRLGSDAVITGYIDEVVSSLTDTEKSITVTGRSKTEDLVDCTPDISSGQFKGYTVEQISRSIASLFGQPSPIGVVVETDATQIFPDATLQRGETAFTFLERLGRLAGVLLTDDEMGDLVLTTAGIGRAGGRLVEGVNILSAHATLSGVRMFSEYIVKGQRALGSAAGQSESTDGGDDDPPPAPVTTNLVAVAYDSTVPRYRPKVTLAEAQLSQAGMQTRANWQRNYAFGRSTTCEIEVIGWRDAKGDLWRINRLITVTSPFLQLDQDLLIAGVTFEISSQHGRVTKLKLGPVEGYTPDPGQVKLHTKRGKKGGGSNWEGAGS